MAAALMLGFAPVANAEPPDPAFMEFVFPPELIMRHASEINLSAKQRKAITRAVTETQSSTIEISWDMQDAAKRLGDLITKEIVDAEAAMAAATQVMELEIKVKKSHMRLLITLKNLLTPEQQSRLRRLREADGG